jgi:hypothetical protein
MQTHNDIEKSDETNEHVAYKGVCSGTKTLCY